LFVLSLNEGENIGSEIWVSISTGSDPVRSIMVILVAGLLAELGAEPE